MNGKVAIFISDVHLGRGDVLEDFNIDNENAFTQFLASQSETYQNDDVDLVVLGDLLDIWQTVSDQDKVAPHSTDIDVNVTAPVETSKVNQIIHAHPGFFKALTGFLAKDSNRRRIILITGNHDHSLVHPDVQKSIRQAVTGGSSGLDGRVHFAQYYDEPELRVYSEHGNQYDANNEYEDFTKFGDECPGYFFVRLFWNRLEPQEPDLDNWQSYFQSIIKRNLWHLIRPAYKLFSQYQKDSRPFERIDLPGIPFFELETGTGPSPHPISGKSLPGSPDILFSDRGDPERIFSTNAATENQLRMLYHDPGKAEFKTAIDDILREKYRGTASRRPGTIG